MKTRETIAILACTVVTVAVSYFFLPEVWEVIVVGSQAIAAGLVLLVIVLYNYDKEHNRKRRRSDW